MSKLLCNEPPAPPQDVPMIEAAAGTTDLSNGNVRAIMFGSCMAGANHACNELPIVLLGSGGGTFKTNQHAELNQRWLRDLHHTVMTETYDMSGPDVESFGADRPMVPRTTVSELLI
jgi:hypothetical protein